MTIGLIGKKVGMSRVFVDDGTSIPVTVLDVADNRVSQLKTVSADGYAALQIIFGSKRSSRVNRATIGHLAKAGVQAGSFVREFSIAKEQDVNYKVGDILSVGIFSVGQKVDISGVAIGKGFAGPIKRHNFSSNRASHGNSVSHNSPGSIGMAQDPGRVFPGKRMAGHLGSHACTVQNLEVVRVDETRQLLLVKGAIPGAKGGSVVVTPSVKAANCK